MSMVEPGAGLTTPGTGDTPPPTGGKGIQSWSPAKKIGILGGGGLAALLLIYLYAKHKSASSSSASTVSGGTGTTPTLVLPSSNQDAVGGTDYASLAEGLGNLSNQVSSLNTTPATPTTPATTTTPTPVATAAPTPYFTAPGPGGETLDIIGAISGSPGNFTGYNVGHGAPVYADTPGATTWRLGLTPAQLVPGTTLAVPDTYWGDVVPGVGTEQLGA